MITKRTVLLLGASIAFSAGAAFIANSWIQNINTARQSQQKAMGHHSVFQTSPKKDQIGFRILL